MSAIGASRVSLFISTQVPFAAFFAIAFTGESLTPLVALGTLAVMAGLLLASGDSITQGWRTDRRYLLGCLSGLMAGAATGGSTVLAKQTVSVSDSPLTISALGMLAAMFIVIPVVGIIAARSPAVRAFDWKSMGFVCLSGLSTTVSIVAQLFAVQRADVLIVAPILATFPLWTLLLAHVFIARPGADNPAPNYRRDCDGGGRGCGGGWRAAMTAGNALTLTLSQGEREFSLLGMDRL